MSGLLIMGLSAQAISGSGHHHPHDLLRCIRYCRSGGQCRAPHCWMGAKPCDVCRGRGYVKAEATP